ncbi:hypothetical protein DKP78_25910, partial [Enterococcus faecium]
EQDRNQGGDQPVSVGASHGESGHSPEAVAAVRHGDQASATKSSRSDGDRSARSSVCAPIRAGTAVSFGNATRLIK